MCKSEMNNAKFLNEMKIKIDGVDSEHKAYLFNMDGKSVKSLIHVRLLEEIFGLKVNYINRTNLEIDIDSDADIIVERPLNGVKIVVDAGHGGKDGGAVDWVDEKNGDHIDTLEKDLNLNVAKKLIDILEDLGAIVIATRITDKAISLSERVNLANNKDADLYISIHFNAASSSAEGIETFKYTNTKNPISNSLAANIHKELMDDTNIKLKDRGVKKANFYVLRKTSMPSVLLELGFITNTEEEKIINQDSFQTSCAYAISRGILTTVTEYELIEA